MKQKVIDIVDSIKKMSEIENYYIFEPGYSPLKVKFSINPPATKKDIRRLKKYGLPQDYIDFITLADGASLFEDGWGGSRIEIYSIKEIFKWRDYFKKVGFFKVEEFPVAALRDVGQISINLIKFISNKPYLTYPDDNCYFSFSFIDWLEKILKANGNEFWYFGK